MKIEDKENIFNEYKPNNIYNVDCYEAIKKIPDKSIDCVITSPPYDNLRTYNNNEVWNFEKFKLIANELFRVVKAGGVIVWIVNDATINGSESGTSFKQTLYFKEIGFNIHDTMIWEKPTFTDVGSLNTRYAQVFEYMFILSKGKPKTFNAIKDRPIKNVGLKKSSTIRQKNGELRKKSNLGKVYNNKYGQRFNVWHMNACVSNKERTGHPAQFPIQLIIDHILSWTNQNDVVLDPFMGSGTTAVACKETGRKYIGFEIDEEYYKIAVNRLNGYSQKDIKKKEKGIINIFDLLGDEDE